MTRYREKVLKIKATVLAEEAPKGLETIIEKLVRLGDADFAVVIVTPGDGDTDIPAMKTVRLQGGQAIAVFGPGRWQPQQSQAAIYRLIAEDRVHFVAPADYRAGSQLDVIVCGILGRIARENGYRGT